MEKRRPHYRLDDIKAQFRYPDGFHVGMRAQEFALVELALDRAGLVELIQEIQPKDFYKSMTSYRDHRIWQDVYHLKHADLVLYVKFSRADDGFYVLVSMKEK